MRCWLLGRKIQSALEGERAKLSDAAVEQKNELQNLQIAVETASNDLKIADGKLETAKSQRKLLEHKAWIESQERKDREDTMRQNYERLSQEYAQAMRNKEFQIAQLSIQKQNIEDKLANLPVIKSPRNGWVSRIKPWVGSNGRYTTTITITDEPGK